MGKKKSKNQGLEIDSEPWREKLMISLSLYLRKEKVQFQYAVKTEGIQRNKGGRRTEDCKSKENRGKGGTEKGSENRTTS